MLGQDGGTGDGEAGARQASRKDQQEEGGEQGHQGK